MIHMGTLAGHTIHVCGTWNIVFKILGTGNNGSHASWNICHTYFHGTGNIGSILSENIGSIPFENIGSILSGNIGPILSGKKKHWPILSGKKHWPILSGKKKH